MITKNEIAANVFNQRHSYFGEDYNQKQISLFTRVANLAGDWAEEYHRYPPLYPVTKAELKMKCSNYIKAHKDALKEDFKPSGFFEPLTFSWILGAIIKWVVEKVIEYLIEKYKSDPSQYGRFYTQR